MKGIIVRLCAVALKEHTNGDLPHSLLEAPCTPFSSRGSCGLQIRRLAYVGALCQTLLLPLLKEDQFPPRFLSVPSAVMPKGPKASTAFSSVLLWTSRIVSSFLVLDFPPLKELLKQAML